MSDRRLTVAFVGIGFIVAMAGSFALYAVGKDGASKMLDAALVILAALMPSPLSKTTTAPDA